MTYRKGDIIRARGARQIVEIVVTEADLMPDGDEGLLVVVVHQLEESERHVTGSTLYLTVDEIEDERRAA